MAQQVRQSAAGRRLIMRHFRVVQAMKGSCCIRFDLFAYFASFAILRFVLLGKRIAVNTLTLLQISDC